MKKAAPAPYDFAAAARKHVWLAGVIVLAMLAYANSLHAPFLLDNNEVILKDSRVHAATSEHLEQILGSPYYQAILSGLYRPLTTLSYLVNYAVLGSGANPDGYHWFNLLLHCVNIALVYALGMALFAEIPAAVALSALWGLHPVLTESVTNIVGRADLLAAFGVLASLICYRRWLRSSSAGWLAAIACAAAIGMFAKESGIVAIAGVALYDWAFERERAWRQRLAGYAAVVAPALLFLAARAHVLGKFPAGPFPFTDNPIVGAGFWTGRMTAIKVIGKYLGLLLWPAKLAPDYSYNEISVAADGYAILSLLVCLAAAGLAIRSWRRAPALFFSIAFFFATLAPTANLVILIGSIMAERFLYLPSVGFIAAVVYGLRLLAQRAPERQKLIVWALGFVLLVFTCRVYARNLDWMDEQRFWQKAVEAAPGSFKARITQAGLAPLGRPENWGRALDDAERALAVLNDLPDGRNSGFAYRQAGMLYREFGERLAAGRAAANGNTPEFWYRKSLTALLRSERIERALDETYRVENIRRGTPQATFLPSVVYLELGRTYLRLKDPRHAIEVLEIGRNLESDPDLLEELAAAYFTLSEPHKAGLAYVEALEVDSSRTQLAQKLVEVYQVIDPTGCAISREGGAPSLNIACPLVHADVCAASLNVTANYERRNQTAAAASIRRVAAEDLGCPAPQK